jgi:GTPase SAR1 family protein
MGMCGTKQSNPIDASLKKDRKAQQELVKLLLLGAGESGKSTIAKQVKLIHLSHTFSEPEVLQYKTTIYENVITSMQTLIQAANDWDYEFSKEGKESTYLIQNTTPDALKDADVVEAVRFLWQKEKAIKDSWKRANEIKIIESASYYFDAIDRISDPQYKPSTDDILRARVKTTGIVETAFKLQGHEFRLVDVGGQRSERRKWLHCFQDVTAIIFCVSMSEYDQMLYEDSTVRRTEESMKLFEEICNSKWFGEVDIILFLNKYDLFREKNSSIRYETSLSGL